MRSHRIHRIALSCVFVTAFAHPCLSFPGQVAVHPTNPTWLVREGVGPLFMCGPGDPEGFLYRGSRNSDGTRDGDQDALISKLVASGANCIYMIAVRSHGGDGGSDENPFVDSKPSKGLDDDILDQWDGWFSTLDAAGVVIFLILYDDSASIWSGSSVSSAESTFVTQLVNRFEHHGHMLWCVAEEYAEAYSQTRVENIASAIRAADDHDHPIAVHQNIGTTFHFPDSPDIDQFGMQLDPGSASFLHSEVQDAWNSADGRYQLNLAELVSLDGRTTRRKKLWACAMAGAYVMCISLDLATAPTDELEDCGRLAAFLESTNLGNLAPRDDLARNGTDYLLADPGTEYVAYASNLSGSIGIANMAAGTYCLRWFDPETGQIIVEQVTVSGGNESFSPPGGFPDELAVHVGPDMATGAPAQLESSSLGRIKGRYRER